MQVISAEFMCLQFVPPGQQAQNIAVLIYDHVNGHLLARFIDDWSGFDDLDQEYISGLAEEFQELAVELGPSTLLAYFRNTLSNTLRLSDAEALRTDDIDVELDRLATELLVIPGKAKRVSLRSHFYLFSQRASGIVHEYLTFAQERLHEYALNGKVSQISYATGAVLCAVFTIHSALSFHNRNDSVLAEELNASLAASKSRVLHQEPLLITPTVTSEVETVPETVEEPEVEKAARKIKKTKGQLVASSENNQPTRFHSTQKESRNSSDNYGYACDNESFLPTSRFR